MNDGDDGSIQDRPPLELARKPVAFTMFGIAFAGMSVSAVVSRNPLLAVDLFVMIVGFVLLARGVIHSDGSSWRAANVLIWTALGFGVGSAVMAALLVGR